MSATDYTPANGHSRGYDGPDARNSQHPKAGKQPRAAADGSANGGTGAGPRGDVAFLGLHVVTVCAVVGHDADVLVRQPSLQITHRRNGVVVTVV